MKDDTLTLKEQNFLAAYQGLKVRYGSKLTYRIIARELGYKSPNSITQYMRQLEDKGYLRSKQKEQDSKDARERMRDRVDRTRSYAGASYEQ